MPQLEVGPTPHHESIAVCIRHMADIGRLAYLSTPSDPTAARRIGQAAVEMIEQAKRDIDISQSYVHNGFLNINQAEKYFEHQYREFIELDLW